MLKRVGRREKNVLRVACKRAREEKRKEEKRAEESEVKRKARFSDVFHDAHSTAVARLGMVRVVWTVFSPGPCQSVSSTLSFDSPAAGSDSPAARQPRRLWHLLFI